MKEFLTIGDFAAKTGLTLRTLRYYDKIGLLKPSKYNDKGYRLYSMNDFIKLQKILTLKFIGLSLQDINRIMHYECEDNNLYQSLKLQKKVIENRINQFATVTNVIDEMLNNLSLYGKPNWDELISIMNMVNENNKWLEQYENATNLRTRISIHDQFSINKQGWMPWFFQQLTDISTFSNKETIEILELGCGDGSLWSKNINLLPENFKVTLTDFSQGMLNDAKDNLKNFKNRFTFQLVNAENIPYKDNSFHIVIANHMLFHLDNIDKSLIDIKRVLKKNGYFFASTVGEKHMHELGKIIQGVKCKSLKWENLINTKNFNLENGEKILKPYFKTVIIKRYEDALIINKVLPLAHYILSIPENSENNLDEKIYTKLVNHIESILNKEKQIIISKDTGYFRCNN